MTVARREQSRLMLSAVALAVAAVAAATDARATVTEPNGLQVPQPLTATEISVAASTNPLFPLVGLDTLFLARSEAINWQTDAQSKPDAFSPVCGFTAQLVLRGGGCRIDFGWYNVVPGHIPLDTEIFPLISAADIMALPLMAFEPGAGEQLPGLAFSADTILTDPRYAGGLIGFATRGNAMTFCTQTHYSQQDLNIACTNCPAAVANKHWISSVIYKSAVDPNGYYLAFEDLPMSPTSFAGDGQYKNDGDMNDFVFFVSGVTCPGGGKACDTGLKGFCAQGVAECQAAGRIICRPSFDPTPEICDAVDNDCNGIVDDGDTLCPPRFVCHQGRCVGPCSQSEFPCPVGLVCQGDLCVEPACATVTCDPGKVCRTQVGPSGPVGVCVGPCDGVKCPLGQDCHEDKFGSCVDPCAGVICGADRVCQKGACVPKCQCLACDPGSVCQDSTGKCVPPGCEGLTCDAGQVCSNGACVDGCQGVVCPSGQSCVLGQCVGMATPPSGAGGSGGNIVVGTGSAGASGTGARGGGSGGGVDAAASDDAGQDASIVQVRRTPPSCRCELEAGDARLAPLFAGMALAAMVLGRRRRRRRGGGR